MRCAAGSRPPRSSAARAGACRGSSSTACSCSPRRSMRRSGCGRSRPSGSAGGGGRSRSRCTCWRSCSQRSGCGRCGRCSREERFPRPQPPGVVGVPRASPVGARAGALPAAPLLGARAGAYRRGRARRVPRLDRAAAREGRRMGARGAPRRASRRGVAAARARAPALARLAEIPPRRRGRAHDRRRTRPGARVLRENPRGVQTITTVGGTMRTVLLGVARALVAGLVVGLAVAPLVAGAQGYPNKPVRFIVPFPPGGATDISARIVGQKLAEMWGQTVVIENRGGAGGNVGAAEAARAVADGYTLFFPSGSVMTANEHIYANMNVRPERDFIPITNVVRGAQVIAVPASSPYRTLRELIAAAQGAPGKLNYGHAGIGSQTHLAAENFLLAARIEVQNVPY